MVLPSVSLCAMIKNEARYLSEWVAFHCLAGVTSIRLYDNGSDDETVDLVARMAKNFAIEVVPWTHIQNTHDMVQKLAYLDGAKYFAGKADFVAFIDADEFVFTEQLSLPTVLAKYPVTVGAIALNQRVFGSSGHVHIAPGLVTSRFTRRAVDDCPEHLYFKTIARPQSVADFSSVHSVMLRQGDYVFADGSPVETSDEHPGQARRVGFGPLRLNHYPLKSLEEFRLKQARFSKTDLINDYNDTYFTNRLEVTNAVEDQLAASREAQIKRQIERVLGPGFGSMPAAVATAAPFLTNTRRPSMGVNRRLIFDIGMSEGNDTQFYLQKGFEVVGVEADPVIFRTLQERFAIQIAEGRLSLHHRAAAATEGERLIFYRNDREQGHSSLDASHSAGDKRAFDVVSINWHALQAIKGIPYFMKIDIELGEAPLLKSMIGTPIVPPYISVECHNFTNIQLLYELGYRKFKLVNQTILSTFQLPAPALEGQYIASPNWHHASGPFGRELPGPKWYSFPEIAVLYERVQDLRNYPEIMAPSWFDCHATTE